MIQTTLVNEQLLIVLDPNQGFSVSLRDLLRLTMGNKKRINRHLSAAFTWLIPNLKKLSARRNSRAAAVAVFAARLCDVGMAARVWDRCCCSPELIVFGLFLNLREP